MSPVGALIIYILIWWCVFFAILPRNIKGVWENPDDHVKGADQGAPSDPQLKAKLIRTSWVAGIFWIVVVIIVASGVIDYRG